MTGQVNSAEDFTLLLFLHMARVDGSLHPIEKDVIIERMRALFPQHAALEEKMNEMESLYTKLGPAGAESMLKASTPTISVIDLAKKKEIYSALFDIINANGRVNEEETQTLQAFKSWFLS